MYAKFNGRLKVLMGWWQGRYKKSHGKSDYNVSTFAPLMSQFDLRCCAALCPHY